MMNSEQFECEFCYGTFSQKTSYNNHTCKLKKRKQQLGTISGQAAWLFFQTWIKLQKKVLPKIESFVKSKYFNSFVLFADFVKSTQLASPEMFIMMMVDKKIQPGSWRREDVYTAYLNYLQYEISPLKQIELTVNTLLKYADTRQCNICDVFEMITFEEILYLVQQQKISPWVLLHSSKFKQFVEQGSEDDVEALWSMILPMWWRYKFEKNPKVVNLVKKCVHELNI